MNRMRYCAKMPWGTILRVILLASLVPAYADAQPTSGIGITDGQARSAGPGHPWQGGPGGVNLYSLAKQTSLPLIGWHTVGGFPMGFALFHNTQTVHPNRALGAKWQHSYGTQLVKWTHLGVDRAAALFGNHSVRMFRKVGSQWVPQDGYRDTLVEQGTNFELTLSTQEKLLFKPNLGLSTLKRYRLASLTHRGITASMTYDGNFRLVRVDEPSGRALRLNYAGQSLASLEFLVGANPQRTWNFAYDGLNRLIQVQLPPVTTDLGVQTHAFSFTYDANHNLATISSPEGLTSQYGYSGNEIAFAQWPGNGVPERVLFSRAGVLRNVTDPVGNTTTYEYDSLSRLVRVRDAAMFDTVIGFADPQYNYGGSSLSNGVGELYFFDYDANGNLVGRIDAAGNRWDMSYDSRNNLIQTLDPLVTDAWGIQQAGRHRTDYVYDANNRRIQTRDYSSPAAFDTTVYVYDANGNLISTTDPVGHATGYQYDAYGNLVRTTTPMGRTNTYFYDTSALSAGFTVPNAWADANGLRTELIRDEWGRLRVRDYAVQPDHQYRYDGLSRLVRMTDASGITNYGYDVHGWLSNETKGAAFVNYTNLPNGLRSSMVHDTGTGLVTVSCAYNSRGLLSSVNDMGAVSQYAYDAAGRLVSRQMGNGASSLYSYANGRLASVLQRDQANAPIVQLSYAYQADGRLAQTNEGAAFTRYGYDFRDRLVREERNMGPAYVHTWAYDSDGLRVQQSKNGQLTGYQNDPDHNVVQALPQGSGPDIYQYDANGRLVQRARNNNAEVFRFSYDTQGFATELELFNNGTNAFEPHRSYQYDGLGRRVQRNVFLNNAQIGQGNYNYGAGSLVRVDKVDLGQPSTEVMTWAGGLSRINSLAGTDIWPATDGSGDLRSFTDTLGQFTGHKATYNAFGEVVFTQGNAPVYQWGADAGMRTEGDAGFVTNIGSSGLDGIWDPTLGRPSILPQIDSFFDILYEVDLATQPPNGSTRLLPAVQRMAGEEPWNAGGPCNGGGTHFFWAGHVHSMPNFVFLDGHAKWNKGGYLDGPVWPDITGYYDGPVWPDLGLRVTDNNPTAHRIPNGMQVDAIQSFFFWWIKGMKGNCVY